MVGDNIYFYGQNLITCPQNKEFYRQIIHHAPTYYYTSNACFLGIDFGYTRHECHKQCSLNGTCGRDD
jgi:hypothetical protein